MDYRTQNNFSIERTLSPRNLDSDLQDEDKERARAFFRTYSGREALLKQLSVFRYDLQEMVSLLGVVLKAKHDVNLPDLETYAKDTLQLSYQEALDACNHMIGALLTLDSTAGSLSGDDATVLKYAMNPATAPKDIAKKKTSLLGSANQQDESFFARIKDIFSDTIDNWRGYTPEAQIYNQTDEAFYQYLQGKNKEIGEQSEQSSANAIGSLAKHIVGQNQEQKVAKASVQNFSNFYGVKNMKFNSKRRAFSNAEACNMLANKLTNDWFVCEPQCQPLISDALKASGADCTTIAPALKCNVLQFDGEAPVSKSELAALDKVQMFIQALKDEIACGRGGCDGIVMVPEAKAFSLKKKLKRHLRCFADALEVEPEEVGTPAEIIEAEEAGIDIDDPEKYEFVADQAEAGNIPPEVMNPEAAVASAAPSIMAPSSMDLNEMGCVYDPVLDSTIADNGTGIGQSDWSAYDSKPGELSLSAANVGEAMAQMNEDAFVVGEEEGMMPAPITADMAAGQNFSRSLYRRNAAHKNFSVKRTVSRPANSTRGLRKLLGDKYLR